MKNGLPFGATRISQPSEHFFRKLFQSRVLPGKKLLLEFSTAEVSGLAGVAAGASPEEGVDGAVGLSQVVR